jgi:hypothetical protein
MVSLYNTKHIKRLFLLLKLYVTQWNKIQLGKIKSILYIYMTRETKKHNKSMRKTIRKSKRKKTIHNKTRSKTRRKSIHKGGRVLGEGAFGIVYGDPRLPCVGDAEGAATNNEVSKYFKHPGDFEREKKSLDSLNTLLSASDYVQLKDYAILPTGSCTIDCSKIGTAPYDASYGFASEKCKPGMTQVMNYPAGGMSYSKYMSDPENINTFEKLITAMKLVLNVHSN